jgi:hypothetical protein
VHSDCCEAMHDVSWVCVLVCTRRMLMVIAARLCMRVLVCAVLCTRRMVTVIAAR